MPKAKEHWKVLKTKKIYSDNFIKVKLNQVVRPNGFKSSYSLVEFKGGIGAIALTDNDEFYLVGQYRYPPNVYSWEIPKGSLKTNKTPLKTAKEELEEETGIRARNWKKITKVHTLLGSTNDKVYLFSARGLVLGKPHPEKREIIKLKKVNIGEFIAMVKRQEVTDATTIAAVMFYFFQTTSVLKS